MKCISCEKELEDIAKYCPYCGLPQIDNCPQCSNAISINKSYCSNCGEIFRYCTECHRQYTLDKHNCENENCSGSLEDFYSGYSTYGVNQQRNGCIIEKGNIELPPSGKNFPLLWKMEDNFNISDIYSSYGRLFWIGDQGRVYSISEIKGSNELRLSNDRFRGINLNDINITISGKFLCLISEVSQDRKAFCYNVSTLDKIKGINGNYRNHLVTDDRWILFKENKADLIIESYDFITEELSELTRINNTNILHTHPILIDDKVYFVTKNKKIYYLNIIDGQLNEIPFNLEGFNIEQLSYEEGMLRFLIFNSQKKPRICSYSVEDKHHKIEELLDKLPAYEIKLIGNLLFICDTYKKEILIYNTSEGLGGYLSQPEILKGIIGSNEDLQMFLPIKCQGSIFILISVKDNNFIKFKIFDKTNCNTINITQKDITSQAKFLYSNGKIFIYSRNSVKIECFNVYG